MDVKIGRREFLKQGSLAGVAVTSGLPFSAASVDVPRDRSVPAAVETKTGIAGRQLDSREFSLSLYEQVRPALSFGATGRGAAERWQRTARPALRQLVGGFPERAVELRAETLETKDLGSYTREKVVFQTRENLTAIGYLLLPKRREARVPAIVCIPGHGRGVDDIVGIAEDGTQRTARVGYQYDFAIQAVERGYAAFALEPLGFGHRRDEAARRAGPTRSSCQPAAGVALLLGGSMVGWRVWDTIRTLDYLQTRPEVDPTRLGVMGISGGGTVTLFTAALDERVKTAVVSGYFNTFRDSIVSLSHCIDNYVPGLLNQMEMYDLAGLVAPRYLFVEAGVRDRIFPIAGVEEAYAHATRIYRAFGVPDRLGREVFEGEHEFHGRGAFEFLSRHL